MTAQAPINVSPLEIERKAGEYLAIATLARLSRVSVDPALEASNRAAVDGEVYIRYNRSSYPESDFFPGARDRRQYFQLFASVIDIRQHEAALLVMNACMGLLTGWSPLADDGKCHPGILQGMQPESDSFISFKNGSYKYQAELSLLTTHAKLTPKDILQLGGVDPGEFYGGYVDGVYYGSDGRPYNSALERAIAEGGSVPPPLGGFVLRFGLWKSAIGQLGNDDESSKFSELDFRDDSND